jgi:hypothetical protein
MLQDVSCLLGAAGWVALGKPAHAAGTQHFRVSRELQGAVRAPPVHQLPQMQAGCNRAMNCRPLWAFDDLASWTKRRTNTDLHRGNRTQHPGRRAVLRSGSAAIA